jgi:5-methylthioadenosine/S-adenosylhomocysteine deaminase
MDEKRTVLRNCDIHIVGDYIQEIGKNLVTPDPEYIINGKHHLIMPGFVNAHSHLQQYFRGVYELIGDFFETNLPLEGYRRPEQMNTLGLASCAEFIYAGCTTSMLVYTYPDGYAKSVNAAGNRCLLAGDIEHVNLEKLRNSVYEYLPEKKEAALRRAKDLYYNWEGKAEGRISTLMCPKAPDMALPEVYEECKEFADVHGLPMTTHLSQSQREFKQVKNLFGKTPPQHLYDLDVMDERLSGAHLTYATAKDTQLVKKTGMSILHCHSVESPLIDWIDMGIPVGIGTDDYFHNMCELIREQRAGVVNRAAKTDGYLGMINSSKRTFRPSFYDMLELATIGSAKALRIDDSLGSIEVGKKADVIAFNLMNPFMTPSQDPVTSVFLYGSPGDIDTVICNGRILKLDGKLITIDMEAALLSAQTTCKEIINRFFDEHPDQRRLWENMTSKQLPVNL